MPTAAELRSLAAASEEKFSRIFRVSPNAIGLAGLEDGVVMDCNENFIRLFGHSREATIGRSALPGDLGLWVSKADRDLYVARLKADGEMLEGEFLLRRQDGTTFPGLISSSLLEIGGKYYSLTIVRDVSRRKEAEAALIHERTFTHALLENLVEGVVACDGSGNLVMFNRTLREWHGLDDHQMLQRAWAAREELFERDGTSRLATSDLPLQRSLGGEVLNDVPLVIRSGQKPPRQVIANSAPIVDGSGRRLGSVMVMHDVTQLQQLNEELEERIRQRTALLELANTELDAFSYSVSHDLRTPLRSIDGFSQALVEECGDQLSPAAKHYLQRVRAGTQRMGQQIDDLLKLSRVNRSRLNRQRLDLSALAAALVEEIRQGDPGRDLESRLEPGLVASGDQGLVRSVLQNLLGNAWKYTAKVPAARIELFRAVQPDGSEAFCVKDNGAGFDMAYAGKLFAPFQRLHSTHDFEGSGIGLAIVQRIIRRHGGQVWATGEVDRGASFFFTLPEQP